MRLTPLALAASALALTACSTPSSDATFNSTNPADRTRAMARASQTPDSEHIRGLITELESSDPAQRMFAIRSLQRLTGETRGYRHSAPEPERTAAVDRWAEWYQSADWQQDIAAHRSSQQPG